MRKLYLNLGCGNRTKHSTEEIEWINVDIKECENNIEYIIIDVTKEFPFECETVEYIYAEQFLEHLNWLDGRNFLINCYHVLKIKGILRLVIPDFKKIFQCYLNQDNEFFEVFKKSLNEVDYLYYFDVYNNPIKMKRERKNNPPPEWHTSHKYEDRKRLKLRMKYFDHHIDIVNWFTHQFGEHLTLFDFESLSGLLLDIGFTYAKKTEIKDIDSHEPTRIDCSLFIEAIK